MMLSGRLCADAPPTPPTAVATAAVAAAPSPGPTALVTAIAVATVAPTALPTAAPSPAPTAAVTPVEEPQGKHHHKGGKPDESSSTGPLAVTDLAPWNQSGVEFCFGATAMSLFNGAPLGYTPFEMGWRFSNGFHIRSGIDLFYYDGPDTDSSQPGLGVEDYSYEMMDWRTSLLYTVHVPGHLRPIVGVTLDFLRGDRKLGDPSLGDTPQLPAWGFLGTGGVLGGEWRIDQNWGVELLARSTLSYQSLGAVSGLGLNAAYIF
jgi:hypothetical protein